MPRPESTRRTIGIGLLITVAGGLIVEWIKDFPVLRWVLKGIGELWKWLGGTYDIQRWYAWMLGLLSLLLVGVVVRRTVRALSPSTAAYAMDTFLDVVWRWGYWGTAVQSGTVTPYCPKCRCQMVFADASSFRAAPRTAVQCEECGFSREFQGFPSDVRERISRLVERELHSGAWRNKMVQPAP